MLELRGAFKHDPQRKRARQNEPLVTTPLPDPPEDMRPDIADEWRRMKARGYWLKNPDKFLVEIAATLIVRLRRNELKHGYVSVLIGLLGKLGFSPKERGTLNLPTRTT
jgi:hypothetical protein